MTSQKCMSYEMTETGRAALLWLLWHHQGSGSEIGQPIRFALGMGQHDHLSDEQVFLAKMYGELRQNTQSKAAASDVGLNDWLVSARTTGRNGLNIEWSATKPTAPGAYWIRGFCLDDGQEEKAALVEVCESQEGLICNLHRCNSDRPDTFSEWHEVAELDDTFEWSAPLTPNTEISCGGTPSA